MDLRALASMVVIAAGCPGAQDESSSSTSGTSSGGTTVADPTTGSAPTTGPEPATTEPATSDPTTGGPTTDEPTTGGPPAGGSRILYFVGAPGPGDLGALRVFEDGPDGPGPATTVLDPPAGGAFVSTTISPSGSYMVVQAEEADLRDRLLFVDLTTLVVTEATLPAGTTIVDVPSFSPDEQTLAFRAGGEDEVLEIYLCVRTPEGTCTAERWSPDPMQGASGASLGGVAFSDDGTRIAYAADLNGGDGTQLWLAATDTPGEATELAAWDPIFTDVRSLQFSAAGDALYFSVDALANATYEFFAIDLGGDPPGPAVPLSPPVVTEVFGRLADDRSGLLWWSGDMLRGDLAWIPIDGVTAGPAVVLNDAPGRVYSGRWEASPDGQRVAFLSDHAVLDSNELYLVDIDPPTAPVHVNAPIGAGGEVSRLYFSPDGQRMFYFAYEAMAGDELFVADLASPGEAVKLSAPLPAGGTIDPTYTLSPDETRLVYMGSQITPGVRELFMVEMAAPGVPVVISPPIAPDAESLGFYRSSFAADGARVYFTAPEIAGVRALWRVDVAAPEVRMLLSAPGESVADYRLLPPAP